MTDEIVVVNESPTSPSPDNSAKAEVDRGPDPELTSLRKELRGLRRELALLNRSKRRPNNSASFRGGGNDAGSGSETTGSCSLPRSRSETPRFDRIFRKWRKYA